MSREMSELAGREGKNSTNHTDSRFLVLPLFAASHYGFAKVATEMFLVFTTTVLLYVVLQSGDILNAQCDGRDYFGRLDPSLLFTCDDMPSLALLNTVNNRTAAAFFDAVESECLVFADNYLGQFLAFELLLLTILLYLIHMSLEIQQGVVNAALEGHFTLHDLKYLGTVPLPNCLSILFCPALNAMVLGAAKGTEGEFCAWSPGVAFSWKIFSYFNGGSIALFLLLLLSGLVARHRFTQALQACLQALGMSDQAAVGYFTLARAQTKDKVKNLPFTEDAFFQRLQGLPPNSWVIDPNTLCLFIAKAVCEQQPAITQPQSPTS